MEDDIKNYLPTLMLRGTPCSLIINLSSQMCLCSSQTFRIISLGIKVVFLFHIFIDFILMYTSEKSKKNLESTEKFDFSIFFKSFNSNRTKEFVLDRQMVLNFEKSNRWPNESITHRKSEWPDPYIFEALYFKPLVMLDRTNQISWVFKVRLNNIPVIV